jgi:predicted transcriptional regulator
MKDLSISETQIMREVWSKKEDIAVPDLTDIIYKKYGKEHKPSTMRTFLGRLMEKDYISTYRVGRYSYVHAEITEQQYKEMLAQRQVQQWFGGSLYEFVSCFGETQEIPEEERKQLKEWIDGMDD